MNKILSLTLIIIFLGLNITNSQAIKITSGNTITIKSSTSIEKEITTEHIFNFFGNYYKNEIPSSYKYINLNFKNIKKDSKFEDSLKTLVYLNLLENHNRDLKQNSDLNAYSFYRLSEKILEIKVNDAESKQELLNRKTDLVDIKTISKFIGKNKPTFSTKSSKKDIKQKLAIFQNVYDTILNSHYNKESLEEGKIIDSMISGITKGTDDKHTVYFPPVESNSFHDSLSGEYEGIGSYVDMEKPGVLKILSPIPGSPSEKAGLKGGDTVTHVDKKEITSKNSLKEVITWIKGPAGTKVNLTINRNGKILEIIVTRAKIVITDIESEIFNRNTFYLQIKGFGENVSHDFKENISKINDNKKIKKIIIDLRNNGGGYLSEVADMLSYFIEKDKPTAIVKYIDKTKTFSSKGYDLIDFSKYKIVILQNSGTASASEILIGTLKDYYPNIEIIGEQSYGKGSVQVMKPYIDGSLLKYTIAKWFTGLTETGIDGIGIKPTIELEFDLEAFKKNGFDNQLNKAKLIR